MDTIFEVEELVSCTPIVEQSIRTEDPNSFQRQSVRQSLRQSMLKEQSLIEDDWELDEILALKRYTPRTKDLLVFELYNSMLELIVSSWKGTPCYRRKRKEDIPLEDSLSQLSEGLEQQKSKSAESLKESRSSTSKGSKSKKTLKKSTSDLKSPAKKKSTKTRKKTSSEAGSVIADPTISETSTFVVEETSLEASKTELRESVLSEEETKYQPPDENVTVVFTNGNVYTGRMSLKSMEGKGTFTWADGSKYEGDFIDNEMTGKGYIEWKDLNWYEGEVYQGLRHGKGFFVGAGDSRAYFGSWKMGHRDGRGFLYYDIEGKDYFEGDWVHDKQDGSGIRSYNSGAEYHGSWKDGFQDGVGIMVWPNNQVYKGFWAKGQRCGYGEYTWRAFFNTELAFPMQNIFMGWWESNKKHGLGLLHTACGNIHMPSGLRFEGNWEYDRKHGSGILTCRNGLLLNATFKDDVLVNKSIQQKFQEPVIVQRDMEINTQSTTSKDSVAASSKTSSVTTHRSESMILSMQKASKPRIIRGSITHGVQSNVKQKHQGVLELRKGITKLEDNVQMKSNTVKIPTLLKTKDKETKTKTNLSKLKLKQSTPTDEQEKQEIEENEENEAEKYGAVLFASEIEIDLSYHLERLYTILCTSELPNEETETSDSDDSDDSDESESDVQPEIDAHEISSNPTFDSYFQESTIKTSLTEGNDNTVSDKLSDVQSGRVSKGTENTFIAKVIEFEKKWLHKSLKQLELQLRKLYYTYATIACKKEPEFPVVLTRLMLWQFARDCKFSEMTDCSLVELDRKLENNWTARINTVYDPTEPLLFWQFLHYLLEIFWLVYSSEDSLEYAKNKKMLPNAPGLLGKAFQKFIAVNVLPSAESHVGLALFDFQDLLPIPAVYKLYEKMGIPLSASQFIRQIIHGSTAHNPDDLIPDQQIKSDKCANLYTNSASHLDNVPPDDKIIEGTNAATLGWEIFYIPLPKTPFWIKQDENESQFVDDMDAKNMSTIQQIGPKKLIKCLADVCPLIMSDNNIVYIEYELTFLEFYEVLLQCALCSIEIDRKIAEAETATEQTEDTQKSDSKKSRKGKRKIKKAPKSR